MNAWDRQGRAMPRLIAALWLLNQADKVLTETPRMPGHSALTAAGDGPPAVGRGRERRDIEALVELVHLLTRYDQADGAEVRRIAELYELLGQEDMARIHWQRAGEMGDEDARGYLEVLEEEEKASGKKG